MPQWLTVALTIFYIIWLFAVLFVMVMVWKKQVNRLEKLELSLMKDSKVTAQAAEKSAEAACMLAAKVTTTTIEGSKL